MDAEWFGYAGAVLMTSMSLPQIARIVRDHSAAGVSLLTWTIFAMSGTSWLAYGLILQAPAIIIGNVAFIATTVPVVSLLLRRQRTWPVPLAATVPIGTVAILVAALVQLPGAVSSGLGVVCGVLTTVPQLIESIGRQARGCGLRGVLGHPLPAAGRAVALAGVRAGASGSADDRHERHRRLGDTVPDRRPIPPARHTGCGTILACTYTPWGIVEGMPTCPLSAFATWSLRRWVVAATVAVATFLLLGLSTAVIPNPVFGRSIPPTSWALNVLIATSVLTGLLTATYVSATAPSGIDKRGSVGALLAYLAIGCPVCNKLALVALGATGAVQVFAPMQPYLAAAGILALLWALAIRLRGEMSCAWVPPTGDVDVSTVSSDEPQTTSDDRPDATVAP